MKTYAYDDAFRIIGITDVDNSSLSQTYSYDQLDRIMSATGSSVNQSWTYDANGNRLTEGGAQPSTYTISSSSNRITSITGALTRTYSYDAVGNTTGYSGTTFIYDDAGRMVSATKASVTAAYALNALGQRVKKTISANSTYFVYDEEGYLLGEYDDSGNVIQEMVWIDQIPVAVLKSNGGGGVNMFYVHTDHLDAAIKISRPSDGTIVWRWDSNPFGITPANEDPDGDSIPFVYNSRFPGQYYDSETGLHYNYFRDYDPATGRYVESDLLGLLAGNNTYVYVGANPFAYSDASGLLKGNPLDYLTPVAKTAGSKVGSRVPLGAAFLGGLAIGTKIYEEFGDEIQKALEKVCPEEGTDHRGRMQAQGNSDGPDVNVSSKWHQPFPLTKGEAFIVLHKTVIQIPQRQLPRFVDAIGRAAAFISNTSPQGPNKWPFYSNPKQRKLRGADRIDIEVWAGQAF